MTTQQKIEIINQELRRVYKLCKYAPSPANWVQWLETLPPAKREQYEKKYTWETAWQHVFVYTHWYLQLHHKKEVDKVLQMVLMQQVYEYYLKHYKAID